ncbi:MAG: hypothetical protein CL610_02530 [Anaerolineaceae bacterium]|nr:hypothetical protein [Anaerolineaceae bacterium]
MSPQTHPEQQAFLLRSIAEQLRLPPVKALIKEPGVRGVYRVTIYYHDRRGRDSCATLVDRHMSGVLLSISYRGLFAQKPIIHNIPESRYENLGGGLQKLRFDHMADQPGMPLYGLDFWMIERAAGSFVHSVIIAPQTAEKIYAQLAETIRTHLPEVLRTIS